MIISVKNYVASWRLRPTRCFKCSKRHFQPVAVLCLATEWSIALVRFRNYPFFWIESHNFCFIGKIKCDFFHWNVFLTLNGIKQWLPLVMVRKIAIRFDCSPNAIHIEWQKHRISSDKNARISPHLQSSAIFGYKMNIIFVKCRIFYCHLFAWEPLFSVCLNRVRVDLHRLVIVL